VFAWEVSERRLPRSIFSRLVRTSRSARASLLVLAQANRPLARTTGHILSARASLLTRASKLTSRASKLISRASKLISRASTKTLARVNEGFTRATFHASRILLARAKQCSREQNRASLQCTFPLQRQRHTHVHFQGTVRTR
jgi:hypothetical protein